MRLLNKVIVIAGPTAAGKTKYAVEAAKSLDGEIVSADSMQVYKYMDIGSAKPSVAEMSQVKHHLIGEIDPRAPFSAAQYQKLAKGAIADIFSRGKQPIVSGGTGLYVYSLIYDMDFTAPPAESSYRKEIEGLAAAFGNEYVHARLAEKDPAAAARIHPNNLKKIIRALEVAEKAGSRIMPFENSFVKTGDYQTELVCLNRERPELYARINARVDSLVEMGLVSEVESLLAMGLSPGDVSMKGIGYKEVISYLNGECDLAEAVRMVKQNTRNYAKRQVTWFKRCGGMKWFNLSEYENDKEGAREVVGWLQEKR